MEAGADDFVTKPFDHEELRARLRAGKRIVRLEADLEHRNRRLEDAYRSMRQDLEAAAHLQRSLLPKPSALLGGCCFDWLFMPSSFVAGDILDYYAVNGQHVAFYVLDVAGHGVRAAMHSVALSRFLSSVHGRDMCRPGSSPDLRGPSTPGPAELVRSLNARFGSMDDASSYFTMVYGTIDALTGRARIVQAGHQPPIHQTGGEAHLVGSGGFAVGMLPDVEYDEIELQLEPGDRLVVYSDGGTECKNDQAEEFTSGRLVQSVQELRHRPQADTLAAVGRRLQDWHGTRAFRDDVTLLAIERVDA